MPVARHYVMKPTPGQEQALADALVDLSRATMRLEGYEDITILQSIDEEGVFLFTESWVSKNAHAHAASDFPKAQLRAVMACVGAPPQAGWFERLATRA